MCIGRNRFCISRLGIFFNRCRRQLFRRLHRLQGALEVQVVELLHQADQAGRADWDRHSRHAQGDRFAPGTEPGGYGMVMWLVMPDIVCLMMIMVIAVTTAVAIVKVLVRVLVVVIVSVVVGVVVFAVAVSVLSMVIAINVATDVAFVIPFCDHYCYGCCHRCCFCDCLCDRYCCGCCCGCRWWFTVAVIQ